MFNVGKADTLHARRMLARYGEGLALDLLDHKEADLLGKGHEGPRDVHELERLRRYRAVVEQERSSPHRLSDLAVDGTDLIELGYLPGPELGRTLETLLEEVVDDPTLNRRETLLARAKDAAARLVIRWEAPGPTWSRSRRASAVSARARSTRSTSAAARDEPERIAENRRRACEELGLDPARLSVNRQRHTPTVHRAVAGRVDEPGDGLWTDEPGLPLLALSADCLPIVVARSNGGRRRSPCVHAGWRGLAEGVVEAGVRALGGGPTRAVVGPAIGPCCYEVGPEVSALFDPDLTKDGILDLWTAAERALRRAGVAAGRPRRPLHALQPGAVLLAPPQRARARRAGRDRCCRRLSSASATTGSARRSARA